MLLSTMLITGNCNILETKADACYYRNSQGVSFTREEYTKISNYFDSDSIAKMSPYIAEALKNNEIVETDSEVAYFEVIEKTDSSGNVTQIGEREISFTEAQQKLKADKAAKSSVNGGLEDRSQYHTSMKKITMHGYKAGASVNRIEIKNEWLSLPKTRSFDVLALRVDAPSVTISPESIRAKQIWDGKNEVNYDSTGDHVKKASKGIGVSMNLSNKAKESIVSELNVTFLSGKDPFKVYGSYQHAKENVSLKTSKKYTISKDGYGNVIKFKDTVKDKYDGMKGINIKLTLDI